MGTVGYWFGLGFGNGLDCSARYVAFDLDMIVLDPTSSLLIRRCLGVATLLPMSKRRGCSDCGSVLESQKVCKYNLCDELSEGIWMTILI